MFHRRSRRARLITAETLRLSRPDPQPVPHARLHGGVVIESAEGTRWAYSGIPLLQVEGGAEPIEPHKVEGARMAAAMALSNQVELPLVPLPEPNIEPTTE